jgi:hypothetical protein
MSFYANFPHFLHLSLFFCIPPRFFNIFSLNFKHPLFLLLFPLFSIDQRTPQIQITHKHGAIKVQWGCTRKISTKADRDARGFPGQMSADYAFCDVHGFCAFVDFSGTLQ